MDNQKRQREKRLEDEQGHCWKKVVGRTHPPDAAIKPTDHEARKRRENVSGRFQPAQ